MISRVSKQVESKLYIDYIVYGEYTHITKTK